jgi:hypothetical protein
VTSGTGMTLIPDNRCRTNTDEKIKNGKIADAGLIFFQALQYGRVT